MTIKYKNLDRFQMKQVIDQVESILKHRPNHCDFEFLKGMKEELEEKLQKQPCDFCEEHCGNAHCVTEADLDSN